MLKTGVRFNVPVRSLLLIGSLILLPAWARADDMSFSGGSGCGDPPIFSEIFTFSANPSGGMCKGFGNHTTKNFVSLRFTTSFPNANPSDPFLCSPGPFVSCDFKVDGTTTYFSGAMIPTPTGPGHTISIEFFGNADHDIPVDPILFDPVTGLYHDNFFINLNNPNAAGIQPFSDTAAGDWLTDGVPDTFTAVANNAVPEPKSGALVLTVLGALVARIRMVRRRSR